METRAFIPLRLSSFTVPSLLRKSHSKQHSGAHILSSSKHTTVGLMGEISVAGHIPETEKPDQTRVIKQLTLPLRRSNMYAFYSHLFVFAWLLGKWRCSSTILPSINLARKGFFFFNPFTLH